MNQKADSLLPSWHYPAVIAAAFALFAFLQFEGLSLILSTYIPVLLTAALVTWLELTFPHRAEWRPAAMSQDGYLLVVVSSRGRRWWRSYSHMPHAPARAQSAAGLFGRMPGIWIQAVLMILLVDFLRCWLHRAAHGRHALAAAFRASLRRAALLAEPARFRTIEKALQMALDSLPFLYAGRRKVLAPTTCLCDQWLHQHCSIRLRYG